MVNNKCSVALCPVAAAGLEKRGKARGNVTHFSFPKDPELYKIWLTALCRENYTPTTSSRICEIHFNLEDFIPPKDLNRRHVVKRLKPGSIPTRHLGDGLGLEEEQQAIVHIPGVELETVVTDGTVHYETIEGDIATLKTDNVGHDVMSGETVYVKMEEPIVATKSVPPTNDGDDDDDGNDDTLDDEKLIKMVKVSKSKPDKDMDFEPTEEVKENTMTMDEAYFEKLLPSHPIDKRQLPMGNEPQVRVPLLNEDGAPASDEDKVRILVNDLKKAYKKNQKLVKINKSLRLQLHQSTKKKLSRKAKHEVVHQVMSPFFTQTQIDCFCRPTWLRSRNWTDTDFELALNLRKLMSKKAFCYLRNKRVVPMPSLTSLRKYQRVNGIVINHNPNKVGTNAKGVAKKRKKDSNGMVMTTLKQPGNYSYTKTKVMQTVNVPTVVSSNAYDGQQQIQIVNTNGMPIGTVHGVLDPNNSSQLQTFQLQVVDTKPSTRVKTADDNWKFIQVTPDGQTTTYIQEAEVEADVDMK